MSASRENVRYFINYCWFALDVTAAMFVVCWWSEQKHFSPLGTMPYFHVNSSRKNSIVLTTNTHPTWPPCRSVANQENTFFDLFCIFKRTATTKKTEKVEKRIDLWAKQPLYTCISFFDTFLDVTARLLMRRFMGDVYLRRRIFLSLFEAG